MHNAAVPAGRGSGWTRGAAWRVSVCDCNDGPLARDHWVCTINNEGALKKNLNNRTLSHSTQARHRCEKEFKQNNSLSQQTGSEEYDKIAPVIACTLPALTDSVPERKRGELAGEVTSELQVVGKAASIAKQTWVRNNDKTKARAEEREKNICLLYTSPSPRDS